MAPQRDFHFCTGRTCRYSGHYFRPCCGRMWTGWTGSRTKTLRCFHCHRNDQHLRDPFLFNFFHLILLFFEEETRNSKEYFDILQFSFVKFLSGIISLYFIHNLSNFCYAWLIQHVHKDVDPRRSHFRKLKTQARAINILFSVRVDRSQRRQLKDCASAARESANEKVFG